MKPTKCIVFLLATLFNFTVKAVTITNEKKPIYFFVNHDLQITELRDKLVKEGKVGITGITGKGKSELAKKYVERFKNEYELISFFNVDADLTPQYVNFAKDINSSICAREKCQVSLSPNDVYDSLKNFLAHRQDWLLVFDNIKLKQNDRIENMLNWENNGHIIITTQDASNIKNRVDLSYIKDEDAELLIKKIIPEASVELTKKIIEVCKGYPYLLGHVSTFIANYKHKDLNEIIRHISECDNPVSGFTKTLLKFLTSNEKEFLFKAILLDNHSMSKKLLGNVLSAESKTLFSSIHTLVNAGVLEQINDDIDNPIFQIHDVLQAELLRSSASGVNTANINQIIDKAINLLPKDSIIQRYQIISGDKTMISNLEKILANGELYSADIYKLLELRKYLLDYYIETRDKANSKKLVQWFEAKAKFLAVNKMSEKQKDIYSYYLTKIGVCEELLYEHYKEAIIYYKRAFEIANTISQPLSKFVAKFQLINAQLAIGDVSEAEQALKEAKEILKDNGGEKIKDDWLWSLQAKIFLIQGKNQEVIDILDKSIKPEENSKDNKTARYLGMDLLKAEALNNIKDYQSAYDISNKCHLMNKKHIIDHKEIDAKTLIQLGIAENGLSRNHEAKMHIEEAIKILKSKENNKDESSAADRLLAMAYAAMGDIFAGTTESEKSLEYYDRAENILYNRYRQNIYGLEEVGHILCQGVKAACRLKDKMWSDKFMEKLIKYFGQNNPKTIEARGFCKSF